MRVCHLEALSFLFLFVSKRLDLWIFLNYGYNFLYLKNESRFYSKVCKILLFKRKHILYLLGPSILSQSFGKLLLYRFIFLPFFTYMTYYLLYAALSWQIHWLSAPLLQLLYFFVLYFIFWAGDPKRLAERFIWRCLRRFDFDLDAATKRIEFIIPSVHAFDKDSVI